MDIRQRIARNIKAARVANGWSQEELAEQSGLHRTYISGLERGIRNPTITVVDKLAAALKLAAGQLLDS